MSNTAAQTVCQPTAAATQPVCALKCEAELTAYPSAAEASPLPRLETTPPVMNMYRVMNR